mgnify:CR=1 FL=1
MAEKTIKYEYEYGIANECITAACGVYGMRELPDI